MKFLKSIIKDFNFELRVFIYKAIIIFILLISIFEYTIGSRLSHLDKILYSFDKLSNLDEQQIKKDFFNNLQNRLNNENFFNPEHTKLLIQSFNKIISEINLENEKLNFKKN